MYLEVQNISKKYEDKYAIKDISFQLEKGKFLSLLGPSGSGKSTILHSIGGFIQHTGKIFLDGQDITGLSPEMRDVSTVFQNLGLFPHMTVIENVSYGLKFKDKNLSKKERYKKAEAMLDLVGLKGYGNRMPYELSGGEQQRVALSRSLVVEPKILLMDEPLSALDAKLREKMQFEIRKIQKELSITTIFVTHDQKEAFIMSDEIVVLNKGEIAEIGSPEEIYNRPRDRFTLDFIGEKNIFEDGYNRPENIVMDPNGEEFIIEDITFFGPTIELVIKKADLRLTMLSLNENFNYRVGNTIRVKYKKDKI